jgi:DNA-directed RNA polymerase specialized sigma subunit
MFTEREPTNRIKYGGKDREGEIYMTTIYIKDARGLKVQVEVTDEQAAVMTECRREEWRNEAKERYYRGRTLSTLTDDAVEFRQEKLERNLVVESPEDAYIAAEEREDRAVRINAVIGTMTDEQKRLVKMLLSGQSVTEIAEALGVGKSAVSNMRIRLQKKFEGFLK